MAGAKSGRHEFNGPGSFRPWKMTLKPTLATAQNHSLQAARYRQAVDKARRGLTLLMNTDGNLSYVPVASGNNYLARLSANGDFHGRAPVL